MKFFTWLTPVPTCTCTVLYYVSVSSDFLWDRFCLGPNMMLLTICTCYQVTEIDGSTCQDFFTLLNLSQYYSQDQLLNIHSISCLRLWLLGTHFSEGSATPSSGGSGLGMMTLESPTLLMSSASFVTKARQVLVEKACEYCLRVVDQCERSKGEITTICLIGHT